MSPSSHSTTASELSITGAPVIPGRQPTPENLSPPEMAKARHTASWCSPRMFTQKEPAARMRGQLVDVRAGASTTMGGSSESAANDWHEKPTGAPSSSAVTIVTPVAKWPSTSRNRAWSRPVVNRVSLRLAQVDGLAFVGRRDILELLGLGQAPGPVENAVELAVGVRGIVVREEQPFGAGLGGHVHGVGRGGMTPVGLGRELVVGVLPVVHEEIDVVAELEHGFRDGA